MSTVADVVVFCCRLLTVIVEASCQLNVAPAAGAVDAHAGRRGVGDGRTERGDVRVGRRIEWKPFVES